MKTIKDHLRETITLAFPVIIGQLGVIMMGIVDSLMVGELGAVQLAAASLANSLFIIIHIFGLGVAFAVTPLVAIAVGAGKPEEGNQLFRQSLIVNVSVSFILMAAMLFGAEMLQFMHQPPGVVYYARSYARIQGVSLIIIGFFLTYKQFIEGFSLMRPAMIVTLLANIVNAFFNWILIFGKLGFPALGLDGAGWSTFFSRLFLAASLIWYTRRREDLKKYDMSISFRPVNWPKIKELLSIGIPGGLQYLFEAGAFSFAVIMVGWLGAKQLAAHEIAINLASVSFMAATGISAAGSIRVGNAFGKKDIAEIRKAGFSAIFLGASFMGICGIIFIVMRNILPAFYINDNEVISIASGLLVVAAFFQLSDGTQAVGIGVLRGLTDVKAPTLITFISYWIVGLPVGYYLAFIRNIGVTGIWFGLLAGLTCSALLLTLRFNRKSKKAEISI
jgi:MATE family multidrug resistance protein